MLTCGGMSVWTVLNLRVRSGGLTSHYDSQEMSKPTAASPSSPQELRSGGTLAQVISSSSNLNIKREGDNPQIKVVTPVKDYSR